MQPIFSVSHTVTRAQHKAFNDLLFFKILKGRRLFMLCLTLIMLSAAPVLFPDEPRICMIYSAVTVFLFVCACFLPQRYSASHIFLNKKKYEGAPVEYRLYEDAVRITLSDANRSCASVPYSSIFEWVETEDALLLLNKPPFYVIVLPKDAFSADALTALKSFLTEKTGKDILPPT